MLGPPPLPRNLEAAIRDLDSTRAEVRASAIEDLVRHARLPRLGDTPGGFGRRRQQHVRAISHKACRYACA